MNMPSLQRTVSERLADLNEPIRLRLLAILELEELSVGEVASVVQSPQSTVSRHLKMLSEGGWLVRRSVGTASYYRLLLDELDAESRALWVTVRPQVNSLEGFEEDRRRLSGVLMERRADSLAFFGRMAGEWDELRRGLFGSRFTAEALLSLVPADWTVADLGCGTGNAAEQIAPYVGQVVAVDQSDAMLGAARRRLSDLSNIEYREGSLESLPLPDASVDATICLLVLHHLEEPGRALREMRRVLRTYRGGGVALIVDMVEHHRTEFRLSLGHRHLGFAQNQMQSLFKEAGFASVRVREMPSDPEGKGPGLFVATARLAP
ncbi:MAG: methyltransferase domain-containing protein [Phycisphaeraceae bacterium]|nr:methyltransferase domain-containing protein [Phycisphaeraceae bacterium]